jgi:glycosyltransferase involved in cell wall biosynthesis
MKKNMHIDVVVKYFIPVTAGIETNILETYSVLAEKGWDITIHTSKDTHLDKDVLSDYEEIRGLKVKRYSFGPFGYEPNIDWENTDLVALHNFDMFPHFQLMLKTLWLKLKGKKNFKLVITPHGGFNPEWSIFPFVSRVIKWTYHMTLGAFLANRSADGIRAVSDWEKAEMSKWGLKDKLLLTISNGVEKEAYMDIDKFASNEIKEKVKRWGKYITQIGRVYPIKNYETDIKAMYYLPKDINLVIVGPISDRNYKQELDELIVKLGLQHRVFFAGVLKGVDKYYFIKNAQMMVHMALWESFCNVVHEGLSQGLVCIVANNTALPFLVKHGINGYHIETKDHVGLAKQIMQVMKNKDSDTIKEMKERNRAFGLEHSWMNVADKMDEWYKSLIATQDSVPPKRKKSSSEKPLSVTVGISAHNEEKNIAKLIRSIKSQKENGFVLEKIIIACDGCTDNTVKEIKSLRYKNVVIINDGKRVGKPARVNQIFNESASDAVIILDADIKISSTATFKNLLSSMSKDGFVVLSYGSARPTKPITFTQKVVTAGHYMWENLYSSFSNAQIYHCVGTIRAFRKSLYKIMKFPQVSAEDTFPFLYCMQKNLKVSFEKAALVEYALPATYADYRTQILRFLKSEDIQAENFNREITHKYFVIRTKEKVSGFIKEFIKNPFWVGMYVVYLSIPKLQTLFGFGYESTAKWQVATSTKKI